MSSTKETILLTGGSGFIGTNVIRNFLSKGNIKIVNIDCLSYAGTEESNKEFNASNNYIFEKVNICNAKDLNNIFATYKPNKVLHLAAESHVDRSIDNPIDFINTNVFGTFNLLETSRKYFVELDETRKKKFLFHHVSTDEVYGDLEISDNPFKETNQYKPSSPYSASKASSDHLVQAWHRTFNLPTLITNCSNNYGPFQFPEKLIPLTIINALRGKKIQIYGKGDQIRDWLYVNDHAEALWEIINGGDIGEVYNIGGNNEMKNLEVILAICRILDQIKSNKSSESSYKDLICFVEDRPGHDKRYAIDSTKLTESLNWMPKESFETGIKKTVLWYLDNEWWWKKIIKFQKKERLGLIE